MSYQKPEKGGDFGDGPVRRSFWKFYTRQAANRLLESTQNPVRAILGLRENVGLLIVILALL